MMKKQLKLPKLTRDKQMTNAAFRELMKRDRERVKKWREKDKKVLFERVKERYLQYRKMKVNLLRIDPYKKLRRLQSATLQS